MSNDRPIGFLDSGIGGVTVLKKSLEILPNENYFFYSDSLNNPYGDKEDGEIIGRCDEIADFLINEKSCKAIVLACNTASAKASGFLREKYADIPILAIEPAYKMVHDFNPRGFTVVMATKGTIESEKFHRLFYKYYNQRTRLLRCVGLADLIENGDSTGLEKYLTENLGEYKGRAENVVLGCTHYPLAKKEISRVLGKVNFFDGSLGVSKQLKRVLEKNGILSRSCEKGSVEFFDSSLTEDKRLEKEKRFYKLLSKDVII